MVRKYLMGVYVRGDNLGNSGFQMFVDIEIRKYKSKSMFNLNFLVHLLMSMMQSWVINFFDSGS